MSPVLIRPRSSARPSVLAGLAVMAVVAIGGVLAVSRLGLDEPSFVRELTVVNPLVYKIDIEVKGPDHTGWTDLGTIRRETTKTIEEVVDQGSHWVFRFSYGGEVGGEMTTDRSGLEATGWRITVPADVGERLRQAGLKPSAP